MGPPLASAYAVDPVAVATITPSASMTPTACPPTSISTRSMRASPEWSTTTSLRPIARTMFVRSPAKRHLEDRALLDPVVAVEETVQAFLELIRLDLGEEAEAAEVDAEDRNAARRRKPRAREKSAVAAERHDESRVFEVGGDGALRAVAVGLPPLDACVPSKP